MHKYIALCLAAAGFAAAPLTPASAQGAAPASTRIPVTGTTALPATVRINDTVVVTHRRHRHFRVVRRVRFVNGHRVVTTRRIYD